MDEKERQSKIDKNIDQTLKSINRQSYEEVSIKPFFAGNQYFAFVSITYKDVRMVGAPPESLGKYGADTDNWVWPRHQADFSVFRIYADANNLPAEYSPNNKPFTPKHFLPVSLDGIKENDFTLVMGFPGTTNEYLPGIAVKQMTEVINPIRISLRTKALNIMDAKMRVNATTKIQYAAKYNNSIANGWKKWSDHVATYNVSNASGLTSALAWLPLVDVALLLGAVLTSWDLLLRVRARSPLSTSELDSA